MAKDYIHADSSVRHWGGKREDYLEIHTFMDSCKSAFPDNRHRALTHNSWFIWNIIPRVFGVTITNSDGREVSTREIAELHISEDYGGFIPSAQDFLEEMPLKDWMNNGRGEPPPSSRILRKRPTRVRTIAFDAKKVDHD